ncbi:hypothetical protein G647_02224 [Cladophialophora carrionii CBS 160.54]|uniref:PARP-type domain-containing protein n=1 Tax=Cladophialophora carrionii CBS 160.54 TaxID=1279043 RepID=V9DFM2_9EURO|nr:uncharacterized protein G647_02224 [Cladophialophora carrionii CBS 160.54]ETI25451.1 hypothetical protein G647_02224 [Cladophialophora carrionii CBS 160.54]
MSEPTYRFELAKQGRALCQNSACKHAGVKIGKGEFRMGTLAVIDGNSSWRWKHWGCVTPLQIGNLQTQVGPLEDLDLDDDLPRIIDGYEEIDDEAREKIKFALHNGHVPDEDWKGEPELNRPGKKGINKRTPKKKPVEEDGDPIDEKGETPSKPKPKGGRGKKAKAESGVEADVPAPAPKRKAAGKRNVKVEEEDDADENPPPTKRVRKRKAAVKEEDEEDRVAEEKLAKKPRAQKVKVENEEETTTAPAKRSRAKKPKVEEHDDEDMPDALQPEPAKRERVRKGKNVSANPEGGKNEVKPSISHDPGELDDLPAETKPSSKAKTVKRGRKGKAIKQGEAEEDTHDAHEASARGEADPETTIRTTDETTDETKPNVNREDRAQAQEAYGDTNAADPAGRPELEEPDVDAGGVEDEREEASKPTKAGKGKRGRKIAKGRAK